MADPVPTAEINPYAPPSIPDPLVRPDPGIGVWRDGNLFVTHRDAQLPPICVQSGLPAAEWVALPVNYFDLFTLTRVVFVLRAPLSARTMWWRRVGPRIALAVAAIAFACVPLLLWMDLRSEPPYHRPADSPFLFVAVVVGLIAVLGAIGHWRVLDYQRYQRNYFWFAGAHRKFLEKLPPWPGVD
jgi:hypothetical protein